MLILGTIGTKIDLPLQTRLAFFKTYFLPLAYECEKVANEKKEKEKRQMAALFETWFDNIFSFANELNLIRVYYTAERNIDIA